MCTGTYNGRRVSRLMCTYALTDNYSFCVFVLRCLVLTFVQKGVFLYIFEFPQKTGIRFSEKNFLHKCLLKFPLRRKIDNASPYFIISSKTLK